MKAHKVVGKDEILGIFDIPITNFRPGQTVDKWYSLVGGEGEIRLATSLVEKIQSKLSYMNVLSKSKFFRNVKSNFKPFVKLN